MGFMSWLFGKEEDDAPAEPLVLGALLKCDYGRQMTYLNLETDDIDINTLPQACVEDSKAYINIQPFGPCLRSEDCSLKINPDEKWINAEPQGARVNGKEIITTKSTLVCKATGMTIRPVTSGQDGKFARFLIFLRNMDLEYPGLREILEDPYGNLYLEGKYETALQFLEDLIKSQDGGLELVTLDNPGNLEGKYILAALERLLVDCDTRSFDGFMNALTQTAIERDMLRMEGWNKNYLNEAMMELLRIECKETAERIATDPMYRAMVEHRMFSNWLRESVNAMAYTSVIYSSMLAMNNTPVRRSDKIGSEKTQGTMDQEGRSKADLGNKLDYLFGKGKGSQHNIERSKAMKTELSKIGIQDTTSGRQYLTEHLNNALNDSSNIRNIENRTYIAKELPGTPVVEYTATVKESLLMGPGGGLVVESIWDGNRLLTVILKGGQ